jgi:hypothetical protein
MMWASLPGTVGFIRVAQYLLLCIKSVFLVFRPNLAVVEEKSAPQSPGKNSEMVILRAESFQLFLVRPEFSLPPLGMSIFTKMQAPRTSSPPE